MWKSGKLSPKNREPVCEQVLFPNKAQDSQSLDEYAPGRPVACGLGRAGGCQGGQIPVERLCRTPDGLAPNCACGGAAAWERTVHGSATRAVVSTACGWKNLLRRVARGGAGSRSRGTVAIFAAHRGIRPMDQRVRPRKWDCPLRMQRRERPAPPTRERIHCPPALSLSGCACLTCQWLATIFGIMTSGPSVS